MGTPSQDANKSVRVTPEVHARLGRIVDKMGAGATMGDAIALLTSRHTVRIHLEPEQYARWVDIARANGVDVSTFAMMRVEAAIQYGADPGALRRIHDQVHALVRAAGIIPPQSPPGADEQVISAHTAGRRP